MNKNKKSLFDDKRLILIASLILATLSWIIIAGFIDPGNSRTIPYVVIDYSRGEADYKEKNLQIVGELKDIYADVQVKGDGSVIGPLTHNSVTVYPDYSGVNGPGTFDLPLRAVRLTSDTYNFGSLSVRGNGHSLDSDPVDHVTLTFEEVDKKTFPVVVRAEGVTAATGYFKDTAVSKPTEVTVTGPKTEVERIAQVVAEITAEEEREELARYTGVELVLLDANGQMLDAEELGISFSVEVADVEIPIYQIHTIGLTVSFTGLPQNIDNEWFQNRVHLSVDTLDVVGSAAAFEHLANPYPIEVFDVTQLGMGWESDPIIIELPEGLRNLNQLRQVVASFDTTDLVEKTFEVPAENIIVNNGPRNATISPIVSTISVRLMGDPEQINALLPENITLQVEAFGISASRGSQQTIPARVLVPGANRVFAVGSYPVVCDVTVNG